MLVVYACYNRSCKVSYPSQELFLPTCTCQQNVHGSAREFATFWSCGMWAVSKVCSQQVLELLLLVLRPSQSPLTRSFQLCVFAANYERVHHFQVQNLPSVWIFFLKFKLQDFIQTIKDSSKWAKCANLSARIAQQPATLLGNAEHNLKDSASATGMCGCYFRISFARWLQIQSMLY